MFAFGAAFEQGRVDMSRQFIDQGVACVGWPEEESPSLHRLLRRIEVGDIVFIKAQPPGGPLIIKAVGIVADAEPRAVDGLGHGVRVRWVWTGEDRLDVADRYNVRLNTLYEEHHPAVQARVLDLLFSRLR